MVSLLVKLCHKLNLVDCKKFFLSIQSGIFLGNIISADQGATDMIIGIGIGRYIGIGRFIGIADMRNAYRYRLSVSADKKSYIGSLTDIL